MTLQELEQQVLRLDLADRIRILQVLAQSLTMPATQTSDLATPIPQQAQDSIVAIFRNSPLCQVADQLDLSRDRSSAPDRIRL